MADLSFTQGADPVTIVNDSTGNQLGVNSDGSAQVRALDTTGTGTITANGQTVVANTSGCSSVSFTPLGIYVATYVYDVSLDGTTWTLNVFQGEANGIGLVTIPCGSFKAIRLRCTGYTSGTINVTWTASMAPNAMMVVQPTDGYLLTTDNLTKVGGTAITLGQKTMAASLPVVVASDQSGLPVTGTFFQATQPISAASLPLPTGAATDASLTNGNLKAKLLDGSGNAITSTAETTKQSLDVSVVAPAAGYYSLPINIRQTAATAANATVFALRNAAASTKTVYIEDIQLLMAFDTATPLTRSLQRYDLVRFTTATPTAGTALTVVAMDSSAAATQVTDARFLDTGLTTTSVVFGSAFATIGCPATDATTSEFSRNGISIKLAPGEGFCIRLTVAAVVGQSLTGCVTWSER